MTLQPQLVGIFCSTANTNERLRHQVADLLSRCSEDIQALVLEGWCARLSRAMTLNAHDIDDVATILGASALFDDDSWAQASSWLRLHMPT